MQITPTTYIKSNIGTVKNFMYFLSALLFVIVVGITAFVVLSYKDTRENRFEKSNEFHFELKEGSVTVVEFLDQKAEKCEIPSEIKYGNRTYPITTIGENAFTNNAVLTEVTISDSVTQILGNSETGKGAFSGCTALKTVNIGNSVTHIGPYAFKNCVALTSIAIPHSVQFVSDGVFQGCLALEKIELNGNGPLNATCFTNCLSVKTLQLADSVELNDSARLSFSKLAGLENLIISDEHEFYNYDANANCLLSKDNKTLVLAGSGAKVPDSVTTIADWSFGERTPELLYVSGAVTTVPVNAFNDINGAVHNPICTDVATVPSNWAWASATYKNENNKNVKNTVYTNAKLCEFKAKDSDPDSVQAYVYDNEKGVHTEPLYADLFPSVKNPTPFKEWKSDGELKYVADYESTNKSTDDVLQVLESDLNSAISSAKTYVETYVVNTETYVVNTETAKKFKIDFWEEFKTIYYRAKNLNIANLYDYEVNFYIEKLNYYSDIVRQVLLSNTIYEDFKVNKDWKIELKNIVDAVNRLESIDLDASNDKSLIKTMNDYTSDAEKILAGGGGYSESYLMYIKELLRESYENLVVNVSADSPLGREIAQAENILKNRDDYTKKTWRELEKCLNDAYKITDHSLNISVVRKALAAARANLHEVGIEEDMIRLQTWLSICGDLNAEDYHAEAYDHLGLEAARIKGENLNTRSKINQEKSTIISLYNNLELIEYVPEPEPTILNINTLPYFIVAVVLFTGAVVSGSYAFALKRQMRRKK